MKASTNNTSNQRVVHTTTGSKAESAFSSRSNSWDNDPKDYENADVTTWDSILKQLGINPEKGSEMRHKPMGTSTMSEGGGKTPSSGDGEISRFFGPGVIGEVMRASWNDALTENGMKKQQEEPFGAVSGEGVKDSFQGK